VAVTRNKVALKGWRFQDIEDKKKYDNSTESYSHSRHSKNVSKSFSIIVLSA
jgi:hypothetical protein